MTKQSAADNIAAWEAIAERVLGRDFLKEPIDDSERESMVIGLRGISSGRCKEAAKVLVEIKTFKWGKKDLAAGHLVARHTTNPQPELEL